MCSMTTAGEDMPLSSSNMLLELMKAGSWYQNSSTTKSWSKKRLTNSSKLSRDRSKTGPSDSIRDSIDLSTWDYCREIAFSLVSETEILYGSPTIKPCSIRVATQKDVQNRTVLFACVYFVPSTFGLTPSESMV